ncbi:unnamed protein product [Phytomonas sp. EM1]|nr:unnamed protein product [Phytomonas sp. EM1]|eukprot:CCW65123.1 unnamed protein product [Phytomonas sp. isolate EM1]
MVENSLMIQKNIILANLNAHNSIIFCDSVSSERLSYMLGD